MRILAFARNVSLLLALASPLFLSAQFRPPTDEELKMTADSKAPGAAAVYLNVEEITNDQNYFRSFYARIKVLTEKGKELATVEIPYVQGSLKISNLKGRTIHPDGTIVPLDVKPEDLLIAKAGALQVNRKVFTLPSVEVGSILEYRYDLIFDESHFSSPQCEIQRPYFVHKAHYAFTPFPAFLQGNQSADAGYLTDGHGNIVRNLIHWDLLPPGVAVKTDASGRYSIDLSDVPAKPNEEWMPPVDSILYKVLFFYENSNSSIDYWVFETKRWSKEVNDFAEPSKTIRAAANGLIAPGDSEQDKAKKLYKAVQALDNTDFSRKKSDSERQQLNLRVPKHAQDTWEQKSGSSQDIALLYLAMLRALNITAYDMKVVNRDRGVFAPAYLNFDQLDDDIIIAKIDGKEVYLDPGSKMCPFLTLDWRHTQASGVRQGGDLRSEATTPYMTYVSNNLLRLGDLTVDEHGAVTGFLRFTFAGQDAIRWRQIALQNDEGEVKKQFDNWLQSIVPDGVQAHVVNFQALDNSDVNLIVTIKVEGVLGSATSKRILLPGFFFESRGQHPFVDQEKRLEPVDMQYAKVVSDQVTYHLPAGFAVEGTPTDASIPWENHAKFLAMTKVAPGQVTVARQLARLFTFAKPEEYRDLRNFYQKVASNDQSQLVLTKTASAPKGNE